MSVAGLLLLAVNDTVLIEAIELGLNEYYPQAIALVNEQLSLDPTSPEAKLVKAIILDYMMDDLGTNRYEKEFFDLIDGVIENAKPLIHSERRAWGYLLMGAAYSYRAFRYGKKGIYLPVLSDMTNALDYMNKALALDSTLYDAYLAIGIYNYASDEFPRLVKIMLRVGDTRKRKELGIRQLEMAAQKAHYVKDLVKFTLGYIYMKEKRYRDAYRVLKQLYEKYDHSRIVRWEYGKVLRRLGRWKEAEVVYDELLYLMLNQENFNKYYVALASYYLAYAKYMNRKYDKAKQYAMFAYLTALEHMNDKNMKKLLPYIERLISRINRYVRNPSPEGENGQTGKTGSPSN